MVSGECSWFYMDGHEVKNRSWEAGRYKKLKESYRRWHVCRVKRFNEKWLLAFKLGKSIEIWIANQMWLFSNQWPLKSFCYINKNTFFKVRTYQLKKANILNKLKMSDILNYWWSCFYIAENQKLTVFPSFTMNREKLRKLLDLCYVLLFSPFCLLPHFRVRLFLERPA